MIFKLVASGWTTGYARRGIHLRSNSAAPNVRQIKRLQHAVILLINTSVKGALWCEQICDSLFVCYFAPTEDSFPSICIVLPILAAFNDLKLIDITNFNLCKVRHHHHIFSSWISWRRLFGWQRFCGRWPLWILLCIVRRLPLEMLSLARDWIYRHRVASGELKSITTELVDITAEDGDFGTWVRALL